MTTKTIFASAAKTVFALAAVVMMSTAFTSCSKDNNDDNGGSPVPNVEDTKPLPTPKENTVTLDSKEKPIVNAEYEKEIGNNFTLYLYLSSNRAERLEIILNKVLHINGTSIVLKHKEVKHANDEWYWGVDCFNSSGNLFIQTSGRSGDRISVFEEGTLTATGDPEAGTISIKLENGRVVGTGGNNYTLTLSYSGKITKKKK